jgi:hypothetical protein
MLAGPAGEFISLNNLPYVAAVGDLLYLATGLRWAAPCYLTKVSAQLGNNLPS